MSRRPAKTRPTRRETRPQVPAAHRSFFRRRLGVVGLGLLIAVGAWAFLPEDPDRLLARAEAASKGGDPAAARRLWSAFNATPRANARSFLQEARALLALGQASKAEQALDRAIDVQPSEPEPWLLRLEMLRLEDRPVEAARVGWEAYDAVAPWARRDVLRALTLAMLDDAPEDLARSALRRWSAADPDDADAKVALLRRIALSPRAGDPDIESRLATLSSLLNQNPAHVGVREALILTLAEDGRPDRGWALLDSWPSKARDARYDRLLGRWELDYERGEDDRRSDEEGGRYVRAAEALQRVLVDLPHDWRTHYRLARALRARGLKEQAEREAEAVVHLREILEPAPLGRRLTEDLAHLDDPKSRLDLASLCDRVGLIRLGDAWRRDAADVRPGAGRLPGRE